MLWVFVCLLCVCASQANGQTGPDSPTLRRLIQDQQHNRMNLRSFWQEVTRSGTPLIEAMVGDATRQLVTFLWRGDGLTRTVGVVATITRNPIESMTRLPGTNVWFFSTPVPSGARFAYRLAANSPFVTDGPLLSKLLAALQGDPLNRHPWGCPAGTDIKNCESAVEMPGAPGQPWTAPADVPTGTLTKLRYISQSLHNERSVTVYTPAGYAQSGEPCDLLLVFDEGAYLTLVPTPRILDNLIAAGRIRPTVAVLIGNPGAQTRMTELAANPAFVDALADELLPWVREWFHVRREPSHVTIAGSSLGGLTAVFAAFRHPDRFGRVLCQSGDFSWSPDHQHAMGRLAGPLTETGWMAKQFIASPVLPITFYMDAGVFEADQFGTGGMVLETSRHMRDVLLAKGYAVTYQQFVGGHDYLSWRGTFADGLIALTAK
jgi:enterochelin esterase family protein